MRVTEKPADPSKIKGVVFEEVYKPTTARHADFFALGIGWVKRVGQKQIVAYEVEDNAGVTPAGR